MFIGQTEFVHAPQLKAWNERLSQNTNNFSFFNFWHVTQQWIVFVHILAISKYTYFFNDNLLQVMDEKMKSGFLLSAV